MIQLKEIKLDLQNEKLLTPQAYIKLLKKNRPAIQNATFIPPVLGSNDICGCVRVKLKPGYKYVKR